MPSSHSSPEQAAAGDELATASLRPGPAARPLPARYPRHENCPHCGEILDRWGECPRGLPGHVDVTGMTWTR